MGVKGLIKLQRMNGVPNIASRLQLQPFAKVLAHLKVFRPRNPFQTLFDLRFGNGIELENFGVSVQNIGSDVPFQIGRFVLSFRAFRINPDRLDLRLLNVIRQEVPKSFLTFGIGQIREFFQQDHALVICWWWLCSRRRREGRFEGRKGRRLQLQGCKSYAALL